MEPNSNGTSKVKLLSKKEKYELLQSKEEQAELGGEKRRIDSQHKKGKLTARERIEIFLDEGSFEEIGKFVEHRAIDFGLNKEVYLGDGVVTGFWNCTWQNRFTFILKILPSSVVHYLKHMQKRSVRLWT